MGGFRPPPGLNRVNTAILYLFVRICLHWKFFFLKDSVFYSGLDILLLSKDIETYKVPFICLSKLSSL